MERRIFIKNAGVFASSLVLSNELLFANDLIAEPKIRIGIIGCGDRGVGIMNVMRELPQFEIAAICDLLDFRLQNARNADVSKDFKSYKDYRTVLDDKTIDAVIIATPLNMHYEIAQNALKAEKHVYLEKTMTYNTNQAIELIKTKSQYPLKVLQVGHQYRSSPLYYKVKEMIEKGYLGKITQIDCRWDRNAS